MWKVWCCIGNGGHALLSVGDRTEWRKRTAVKHAREYKALHLRDAWVQPVDHPTPAV